MIIVTVSDENYNNYVDLELPTDVACEQLEKDILEILQFYNRMRFSERNEIAIFHQRTNQYLNPKITLNEAGVWNGDYLVLVNRR